jgi:hypothetical protein
MREYAFEVRLRAVVRVRADSKDEATKVVESVLGPPGNRKLAWQTRTMLLRGAVRPRISN